uniref:Nucleoporin NDC1 n=1 Tax=Phallusia mammillata TaxID=59560 RepID=A0A6F9DW57_9ASCI|nr:nucleoporin NDC1 [Phallusia mammillata]
MDSHWPILHEFKFRTYSALFWSWTTNFLFLQVFFFLWVINPWNHVYVVHDYVLRLLSFHVWLVIFTLAFVSATYIALFANHFSVVPKVEVSHYETLKKCFHGKHVMYVLCHSLLAIVIFTFVSLLVPSQYSSPLTDCSAQASTGEICFNEHWLLLLLFSGFVGTVNFIANEKEQKYCLSFPLVQQTRLLYLKCNFSTIVKNATISCTRLLRNFVMFYYFLGFVPRDLIAGFLGLKTCDYHVISVMNIFAILPILWTLLLCGTLLLVFHDVSWNLFNLCNTKRYNFLLESVFPEDATKILTANLNGKQPPLVQHLAFQHLSHVTCHSANVRKQIFSLERGGVGNRSSKWNVIADECLLCIKNLTNALTDHNLKHSSLFDNDQKGISRLSSKSSTSSQSSTDEKSPFLSVSTLRRRPLQSDASNSPNMSYFDVSSLDATTTNSGNVNSPYRSGPNLVIPTPKLWTRQLYKGSFSNSPVTQNADGYNEKVDQHQLNKQMSGLFARIEKLAKKFSIVSYLIKKMPDRSAANLFSGRCVCKWALQSISIVVEASFTEDNFGVVQRRLHEIIAVLLDLHTALEKYNKLPVASSSQAVLSLLREIRGLRNECKNAIYRITNTFGSHLDAVPINPEHKRKLRGFVEHKE